MQLRTFFFTTLRIDPSMAPQALLVEIHGALGLAKSLALLVLLGLELGELGLLLFGRLAAEAVPEGLAVGEFLAPVLLPFALQLRVEHPDCEHDFPEPQRQAAYQFLDEVLR